jgi:lipopolysaccharide export system protein LptA
VRSDRTVRRWRAATVGVALAVGLSSAAHAQLQAQSNGPIDIAADNGTLVNSTCEATWSGAAEALQGNSRLRANTIKAFLKKKPAAAAGQPSAAASGPGGAANPSDCGATERIEADGNVFYVTPDQVAHGDHAVYSADADQIVMTGDVIVVQGEGAKRNVVRGDKMIIHVSTREVTIVSNAQGRGVPNRVRGVFYPSQPGAPGAAPSLTR